MINSIKPIRNLKNKGFTLIEIIGAIVILGIIAIIAFATYSSNLKSFRGSYYTDLSKTLEKSGMEFFDNNRKYRPTKILNAQKVTIGTLEEQNYISSIKDYNGDICSDQSYVLVVKEDADNYSYHACLICNKDEYDNTSSDMYCDETWLDPTKVKYGIGTLDNLFIYKQTTREDLMEKLTIPVSYVRENDSGVVLAERRGTKEGNETLSPIDIDAVNTDNTGTYKVTYKYDTETKDRDVIVYEDEAPTLSLRTDKTLATNISGDTSTNRIGYMSGDWAQNVIVQLSANPFVLESISVAKYQWNADGIWQDFCDTNPCEKKVTRELNQTIQFRIIDTNGHVSALTDPVTIRIDNTNPVCDLKLSGTKVNQWYTTNVNISFNDKHDQVNNSVASDIEYYSIQKKTDTLNRTQTVGSTICSIDSNGITYSGYVEDKAGNFAICEISFKRDTTAPVCNVNKTLTGDTAGVTAEITCNDNVSGVATCPSAVTKLKTSQTYDMIDNAGNSGTCTVTVTSQKQKSECKQYTSGTNADVCGTENCNPRDCECTTSSTCTYWGTCEVELLPKGTFSGNQCYDAHGSVTNDGRCIGTTSCCKNSTTTTTCNTCYDQCAKTCRSASFGCDKWKDWDDVNSCTPSDNKVKCRTVYN